MHGYRQLTSAFLRSQLREPIGFFFLLVFAPGLLLVLGPVFGNEARAEFGGRGFVDNMLPGLTVIAIMMVGIMNVPQNQLQLRSSGVLRRLRVTPLRARTYVASDLTVNAVLGLVGAVLTAVLGVLVFRVEAPKQPAMVFLACSLGLLAMLAIGYTLASLYPSLAAATGIGNGLMILLLLTSGVMIPTATMPSGVQTVMQFSPVHHLAQLVDASWSGQAWPLSSMLVLAGVAVVFGVLATVLFRWDRGK